jgi:FtsP/CotA-like multicopper oxidase with cupredoxin domain
MLHLALAVVVAMSPGVAGALHRGSELAYLPEVQAADGEYTLDMELGLLLDHIETFSFKNHPTFRMKPGESLRIKLQNNLPSDKVNNVGCNVTKTDYCEAGTTNLHTHGLHVSSEGPNELGISSDDVGVVVEPGASQQYEFTIPDNHMGGTHWYHPHHHHATALQAGGGAAGALIVDDPPGYLPEVYSSMEEKVLVISGYNLNQLQDIARKAQSGLLENASAIGRAEGHDTNFFLVNNQLGPTMTIDSHGYHRLRIIYAAIEQSLRLHPDSKTNGANCTWELLAKDGVYLNTIPRDIDHAYLAPGSRADIAMSCTCETYPCRAVLRSQPAPLGPWDPNASMYTDRPDGEAGEGPEGEPTADCVAVTILEIVIRETVGGTVETLPSFSPDRPCYLANLLEVNVPSEHTGHHMALKDHAVTWDGFGPKMTYLNMKDGIPGTNGSGYTMSDWPPITTFEVGSVYEWSVEFNMHPLHFHVNPFQITAMVGEQEGVPGGIPDYWQVGDWHDTLLLDRGATIRMNVDKFTGKMVAHCHLLSHEDEGMMSMIEVGGTEGATFSGVHSCYSSAWSKTTYEGKRVRSYSSPSSSFDGDDDKTIATLSLASGPTWGVGWLVLAAAAAAL